MSLERPTEIPVYKLSAPGISASILPFGAVLQSLTVKDKEGKERDVVVGFDEPLQYTRGRTFDGSVIGRYGNRIKKGTFTVDGEEYHVPLNEKGRASLHGGNNGYDRYTWDVVAKSESSITLSILDKDGSEGYPGDVQVFITYTLTSDPARLTVRLVSLSLTKKTPIMPTTHTFWNLSGFSTDNILEDTFHIPNGTRVIEIDEEDIPTGGFINVGSSDSNKFLDFTKARKISDVGLTGSSSPAMFSPEGSGIDHAYAFDVSGTKGDDVQVQWSSPATGIRLSVKTNQHGVQIYTAKHHDGSTSVKESQKGGQSGKVQKFGCIAIEPQDWIDGINNPDWKRLDRQVFGPADGPCTNWAEYTFDTI